MTAKQARAEMITKYPGRICCVTIEHWNHGDDRLNDCWTITLFRADYKHGERRSDSCKRYGGDTFEEIIAEIDKAERGEG